MPVLSVRPGSCRSSGGYSLANHALAPAVFLHFPLEEKGPWGPFYQLRRVLPKGRQILLKALNAEKNLCQEQTFLHPTFSGTVYNH